MRDVSRAKLEMLAKLNKPFPKQQRTLERSDSEQAVAEVCGDDLKDTANSIECNVVEELIAGVRGDDAIGFSSNCGPVTKDAVAFVSPSSSRGESTFLPGSNFKESGGSLVVHQNNEDQSVHGNQHSNINSERPRSLQRFGSDEAFARFMNEG